MLQLDCEHGYIQGLVDFFGPCRAGKLELQRRSRAPRIKTEEPLVTKRGPNEGQEN